MTTKNDPRLMLVQPVLNFTVPFVPTQLSFSIATAISHFDRGEKYHIALFVKNSKSEKYLTSTTWEVHEMGPERDIPLAGVVITNIKNMLIENEGEYVIEIFADNQKIGEDYFGVYRVEG
ncbi:hypothetical protein [Paenibacillus sp. 7541]|uniref:hypothetical protein n=1 Tax=Paenibacillus sp. 7541 TaxID=2026236 RepID=UPI001140B7DA|nr:hypothetical protein [Paenibacillus sp. 7541]